MATRKAKTLQAQLKPIYRTDLIRKRTLTRCKKDLFYLGTKVLGYDLAEVVPHKAMCDFAQSKAKKKLLVGARGVYKTTFCTVARAIQLALQDSNNRILVVSNTKTNAKKIVSQIKSQFESNRKLMELVPELIPKSKGSIPWSSEAVLLNRTGIYSEPTFTAASVDTQMASAHFSHILGDDVVAGRKDDLRADGVMVLRQEDIYKSISWYKLTMKGLSIVQRDPRKATEVMFTVNRWGVQDFASHIIDNHLKTEENPNGFEFMQMAVHNEDGSLLWGTVMDEERLAEIRRDQGDFMYFTQYECRPYNPTDRGFPPEMNEFYEGDLPKNYKKMRKFCLIDPADALDHVNCYTAMVVVYVDDNNHLWIADAIRRKMDPVEKMQLMDRMVLKHQLSRVYMEENLHKETMKYAIRQHQNQTNLRYGIVPLKHKNRNKDARIARLIPHHERRALHVRIDQHDLLGEMKDWPFSHQKDLIDALGYIMDIVREPPRMVEPELPQEYEFKVTLRDIKKELSEHRTLVYGGGPFRKQRNRPVFNPMPIAS